MVYLNHLGNWRGPSVAAIKNAGISSEGGLLYLLVAEVFIDSGRKQLAIFHRIFFPNSAFDYQ